MQRKRPAALRKGNAPGKRIPKFRPKSTLIVGEFKRRAMQPAAKYPLVLENLRQSRLHYEVMKKPVKKQRGKKAQGPGAATRGALLVNARPKLFGRGASATRQGLRWDARSAIQPVGQDAEHTTKKQSRR